MTRTQYASLYRQRLLLQAQLAPRPSRMEQREIALAQLTEALRQQEGMPAKRDSNRTVLVLCESSVSYHPLSPNLVIQPDPHGHARVARDWTKAPDGTYHVPVSR